MKKKSILYIVFTLCVASVFTIFLSSKVFADNAYVLTFNVTSNHTMSNDNGHLMVDGQIVEVRDTTSNHSSIGTVACTETECTITVEDGTPGTLAYFSNNLFTIYVSGHPASFDQVINANESYLVQDYEAPQENPGENPGDNPGENPGGNPGENPGNWEGNQNFDGNAYLIWSCGTGICFKHFSDIPNFDNGNSHYIDASTVEADNNAGQIFNLNAEYKGWSTDERFNSWVTAYKTYKNIEGDIDWTTVNPADMLGAPIDMRQYEDAAITAGACTREGTVQEDFEICVDQYVASLGTVWASRAQLQPLGEPEYNNAYTSYGDRNFKIVVYNSNYKGIAMGDLTQLQYYPAQWTNPYLKRDQFDISGTTKSNPTELESILLERDVRIKEINVNDFQITNIEALDVPEGAVAISKDGNDWVLSFSSNYYDNVTFKVTDSANATTYFRVKRTTVDAWIKFVDNKPVLNADFYFDRTKSYTDFDITALIEYRDGSEKTVTLTPVKGIDDGLGNVNEDVYETDEELGDPNDPNIPKGKGLKKGCFQFPLKDGEDRTIKRVYMNIEYKGSTSTNYAGSYSGSGKGTLANIYDPEGDN